MIDLESLGKIKKVIAHGREDGPCADGLAAALIVRNVLPEVAVEFVAYESVRLREFAAEEGLLFLDITPPRARAAEFLAAGSLVLDHHATEAQVTKRFEVAGRGAYADECGVSAATLAYREIWAPLARGSVREFADRDRRMADFAQLAGVYDTWKNGDERWSRACEQTAVLYFFPVEDWLGEDVRAEWGEDLFGGGGLISGRMDLGPLLVRKNRERALDLIASAHRFVTPKGTRVVVLASTVISDAGDHVEDVDVIVGFGFRVRDGVPSMKLSFRSRGGFVVRSIAESLGGGGHDAAASAWVQLDSDLHAAMELVGEKDLHPYARIQALMRVW